MTTGATTKVQAEVGHSGSAAGVTTKVQAEVGHKGSAAGKTTKVQAEVAHRGSPVAKTSVVKVEVGYSLRSNPPAWPDEIWASGAINPMGAGPIAATVDWPAYPVAAAWTVTAVATVSVVGFGSLGPHDGTFNARGFSDTSLAGYLPSTFSATGAATTDFQSVPLSATLVAAGAATLDLRALAARQSAFTMAGVASASFLPLFQVNGVLGSVGAASVLLTGAAVKQTTFSAPGLATVTFAGFSAGIGALAAAGASSVGFAASSSGAALWRSNAFATVDLRGQRGVSARAVMVGSSGAFFANGSVKPTTLTVAGSAAFSAVGFAQTYQFGAGGSSTAVLYGIGADLGALAATGAADVEFASSVASHAFSMSGTATVSWAGAKALQGVLAATGAADVEFASLTLGLGVLRAVGAAVPSLIAGQPVIGGKLLGGGVANVQFVSSHRFVMTGSSSAAFASDLTWLSTLSSTSVATADFQSRGAVTTTFHAAGVASFVARPVVAFNALGGSQVALRGQAPLYGTLNAFGGALVILVGAGYVRAVATALGAATVDMRGAQVLQSALTATGVGDVEFVGGALARCETHPDGGSLTTFRGRALGVGIARANGLATAQFRSQLQAQGVLTANGAALGAFRNGSGAAGVLSAAGGSVMAARSNVEIAARLDISAAATGAFVGTAVRYSQLYAIGKATFQAIHGETVNSRFTCDSATTTDFRSGGIVRSAFTAVGYAIMVGYTRQGMVLNPGVVTASWESSTTAVEWEPTAATDVEVSQQAEISGGVTRQGVATVGWEI